MGPQKDPAVPPVTPLIAGSGWQVTASYPPAAWQLNYRQWLLRDASGQQALLYVQATAKVQATIHWSGALGFQGEGYLVLHTGSEPLRLPDGDTARITVATMQRLDNRLLVASAVVSPGGIVAAPTDNLLHTAWDVLRGSGSPYYLARLSVPVRGSAATAQKVLMHLFPPVLASLQRLMRNGGQAS
jgi:hypothetical protein